MDHNKLCTILQEMGIPDHLTCLLINLYAGQEATVRTRHVTADWFQFGKEAHQSYVLPPCLFNLYAEYIMRNAGLNEAQAEIKIAVRNINNLRYEDDTTLMEESKEELKSLLMKVKEESEKLGLRFNVQKPKGFLCGSAGKESPCNVGDLGSISALGRPLEKERLPTPVFWSVEFRGLYSPWGRKESDMTERLSLTCKKK